MRMPTHTGDVLDPFKNVIVYCVVGLKQDVRPSFLGGSSELDVCRSCRCTTLDLMVMISDTACAR